MKKRLITFLMMSLIVSANVTLFNSNKVQAADTDNTTVTTAAKEKIKVSLENIRAIMVENSLDMKKYENNLKKAKENYEYNRDQYGTISELKNKIDDTQDEIDNFTKVYDSITGKQTNADEYTGLTKNLSEYESELKNSISLKYSYKKAKQDYANNVETAINTAQKDYLDYLVTLSQKELKEDTAKSKGRDTEINKIKYDSGFMAKKDYLSSTFTNTDANNALIDYTNKEALAKIKLCNELGVSPDDIIIESDITEDFQKIGQINYENDLKVMLSNNIDIQEKTDSINQLEDENDLEDYNQNEDDDASEHNDTIYDYNLDNAKIDLTQTKKTSETDFRNQYNTLMNSYNSIKNSYDKIIEEQTEYKNKQVKYDYGFLAKNDLDDAKLTFDTDKATFIQNRNNCYLDYLKYIKMKEGY